MFLITKNELKNRVTNFQGFEVVAMSFGVGAGAPTFRPTPFRLILLVQSFSSDPFRPILLG